MTKEEVAKYMRRELKDLEEPLSQVMNTLDAYALTKGKGVFALMYLTCMAFAEKYIEDEGRPEDLRFSVDALYQSMGDMLIYCYGVAIVNRRDANNG